MQKLLDIMTLWLLSMAAFCSCTDVSSETVKQDGTIMISGTVSSLDSNSPIEGVKVIFNAFSSEGDQTTINTQNVYTDSHGVFNITVEEINTTVNCIVTTEHEEYLSEKKEIIVNWKGISYDAQRKIFYVNDCDFHLTKK